MPGVVDAPTGAALVHAIDGPLNIMAGPNAPSVPLLGQLGVARVSVGPGIAEAALATVQTAARELLTEGTYKSLERALSFSEVNGMLERLTSQV